MDTCMTISEKAAEETAQKLMEDLCKYPDRSFKDQLAAINRGDSPDMREDLAAIEYRLKQELNDALKRELGYFWNIHRQEAVCDHFQRELGGVSDKAADTLAAKVLEMI